MNDWKGRLLFLTPLGFGLFCLIQGAALAQSASPLAQLMGLGLWLWLPACAYYTWKGRGAFVSAATGRAGAGSDGMDSPAEDDDTLAVAD
jgi:hypothetical protein